MGARISMNLTYWVINELLFGKNEWIVDMALNKALLLGDCWTLDQLNRSRVVAYLPLQYVFFCVCLRVNVGKYFIDG